MNLGNGALLPADNSSSPPPSWKAVRVSCRWQGDFTERQVNWKSRPYTHHPQEWSSRKSTKKWAWRQIYSNAAASFSCFSSKRTNQSTLDASVRMENSPASLAATGTALRGHFVSFHWWFSDCKCSLLLFFLFHRSDLSFLNSVDSVYFVLGQLIILIFLVSDGSKQGAHVWKVLSLSCCCCHVPPLIIEITLICMQNLSWPESWVREHFSLSLHALCRLSQSARATLQRGHSAEFLFLWPLTRTTKVLIVFFHVHWPPLLPPPSTPVKEGFYAKYVCR